ncbi:MAG: hypothetical protein IIB56_17280 [Planctomycetes bacterium]|nr:hypothetical protein [Planctomycetota bacterium]
MAELPRVFCLNPVKLAKSKSRVISGDKSLRPAMEALRTEADEALKAGPFSVMDKKLTPPRVSNRPHSNWTTSDSKAF